LIDYAVPQQSAIWLDGTPTSVLPLPDRGLDYGDGLFETLLVHYGKPLFTELHLERMTHGLQALGLPDCLTAARQQLDCAAGFAAQEQWPWAVLRLSVIRGPGPRGYAPPVNARPRILIYMSCLDRDCGHMANAATLCVAGIRMSAQPLLARIKHLNRLEQVLAAAQAQKEDADECIILDQNDHLISVAAGNLFLVRHGELLTPRLVDCGVLGTRRRLIIEKWAPSIGLNVREVRLTLLDLQTAGEVFYSNSLQAVRPVARLNEQCWGDHSVCEALFQRYLDELA
jgi:4-amino-4-deoxychorismate lyase